MFKPNINSDIPEALAAGVDIRPFINRPCAAEGLESYRYKGRYGFIMIGATDSEDAMREAARSTSEPLDPANLEAWDGSQYSKQDV